VTRVLAVLEQRDGAVRKVSAEVVTGARRLADAAGDAGVVDALILSAGPARGSAELGRFGADRVVTATHASFGRYAPEGYTRAIVGRVGDGSYDAVLFAATALGKDLAPRVAARLDVPLATEVIEVGLDAGAVVAVRPVYAGKALLKVRLTKHPAVLSLRPNVFTPVERPRAGTEAQVSVEAPPGGGRVAVREIKAAPAGALDVAEAPIVISGGRGLKEPAHFAVLEELARAFGGRAAVGASRAVVDAGWRPHADQVGQTGKTVSPTLYIAVGISGAIQHLAGMRTSKVIVAINRDRDAPIFKVADYGIVGDLFEVVPKLTEEVKKLQ
jgi:electron transfer flavoprotein alpha subunit